jgi:hypothetical protein
MPTENQNNPGTEDHHTRNEAKRPDVSIRDYRPQKNLGYAFHVILEVV